ncbi:MAG TPA: hypothetical protein VE868_13340, partial [Balneolaceae bacterium]|nr:hypothetical protein [Balneolaceae bacterium]
MGNDIVDTQTKKNTVEHEKSTQPQDPPIRLLAALITSVFIVFLVMGILMPVLPLYVNQGLGFGAFMVGIVEGSRFATSLLSRLWSGDY